VAWQATHHPVSTENQAAAKGSITPAPRKEIVADADWVSSHLNKPGVTVIDARTHEFYNGSQSDGNPRSGHIPGAFESALSRCRRPGQQQIQESGRHQGIISSGRTEAGNLMVEFTAISASAPRFFTSLQKMLGYDAKMYDGSWKTGATARTCPSSRANRPANCS